MNGCFLLSFNCLLLKTEKKSANQCSTCCQVCLSQTVCLSVNRHRDVMFCAALLELRNRIQAKHLAQDTEKNVAEYKCELVEEAGEADADEEQQRDRADTCEQNAGAETEKAVSERAEVSSADDVMEVIATCDDDDYDSLSQKSFSDKDVPSRLDHLEQTEQHEPDINNTTTAGVNPPTAAAYREVLQPTDLKLNEVQVDDVDVIDLSDIALQCSSTTSSKHVTVCFEV